MRATMIALATAMVVGCTDEGLSPVRQNFISPLDEQTGWDPAAPLVARAPDMDIPPDYALPDLIRVVDLDLGGFVEGVTERSDSELVFTPNQDFAENRRYSWVIDIPTPVPHGPELTFPELLQEPAVFDTSDRLDVLDGSVDNTGQACLVLSRLTTVDDTGTWTIEVNGQQVDGLVGFLLDREVWSSGFDFPEGDPGVDVLCFNQSETEPAGLPPLVEGDRLRLYWGGQGPWLVELDDGPIRGTIETLRRGGDQ